MEFVVVSKENEKGNGGRGGSRKGSKKGRGGRTKEKGRGRIKLKELNF